MMEDINANDPNQVFRPLFVCVCVLTHRYTHS